MAPDRVILSSGASTGATLATAYRRRHFGLLLEEARALVPDASIQVVVRESESPWWSPILVPLPPHNVLREPFDRGSASGVLLAFLRIFRHAPSGDVVIANLDAPAGAITLAGRALRAHPADDRALVVSHAERRTDVCRASPGAFLRLFRDTQPELLARLLDHVQNESGANPPDLHALYPHLSVVDLRRDVLNRAPDGLAPVLA